MYAIARPWKPGRPSLLEATPLPLLVVLTTLTTVAGALAWTEVVPLAVARALGAGGAHGALLATAVAWAAHNVPRGPAPAAAAIVVLAGALACALSPLGAVLYLAAPAWVWSVRTRVPGFGLVGTHPGLVAAGAAFGALLGAHLLVSSSLTLGYGVAVPRAVALGGWLAYDAGANVLVTETFFRGALFDRAQRRWSFATALALTTAACLGRYLVDPLLPHSLEVTAGAIFYLTLLSAGNCWLYARSGSVVPGFAAGLAFFIAYRLLRVMP